MKKQTSININNQINICEKTTFEMFKNSSLYNGETDNRFFWVKNDCTINGFLSKFKIGLSFRENKIMRVELFCIDDSIKDEKDRWNKNETILDRLKKDYEIQCKKMENSFDARNNYSSIIISF